MTRCVLLTAIVWVAACQASDPFMCSSDRACRSGNEVGWCEPEGFCSFPDAECASGRRFGELAPEPFSGECVDGSPAGGGDGDGGGPPGEPPRDDESGGSEQPAPDTETTSEGESGGSSGGPSGDSDGDETSGGSEEVVYRNFVFITSQEVVPSELGGVAGADALCNGLAQDAGLAGEYVAWLSTIDAPARDRLAGVGGWANTRGEPFAASLDDVLAIDLLFPIRYDETGGDRVGTTAVTATTADGELDTSNGAGDCNGWTEAVGQVRHGRAGALGRAWTSSFQNACTTLRRVVCFGIDDAVAITHELSAPQRVAFVSEAMLPATSGRAGFDDTCVAEAEDAGLPDPSSFVALVATASEAAVDRLVLEGPGWSLVNGVPVVDAAADLGDPAAILRAPISRTAKGTPLAGPLTWSGSTSPTELAADGACGDWSSSVGTAPVGNSTRITEWFHFSTDACSVTRHVLCLQATVP